MFKGISLKKKKRFFENKDKINRKIIFSPLLIIPLALVCISSILIKSVQREFLQSDFLNHLFTGLLGYFLAIFISYIPIERIKKYLIPFYCCSLLSLLLIYFFGISIYGAQRWLSLGIFSFQPSEVAKLSTILTLALVLERKSISSIKDLILPFLIVVIPWLLIFFQPDLGTSLVLIVLTFVMLYWSRMPIEWLLILVCCIFTSLFYLIYPNLLVFWLPFMGYLAYRSSQKKIIFSMFTLALHSLVIKLTPFIWEYGLKDYQKDRLVLFLDPSRDPLGGGYHLLQSKIAIGSGGLLGTGLLNGKLTNLQFIPEQHTDFIFSALGEELGFLGCILVLFLFFVLIGRLVKVSENARTNFESLIIIGIASTFLFQIIINLFMTIGLGPVTGIPLPFMSYGRTSLLINFICIGLALSTLNRSRSLKNK
ncbi:rod shape-determining protein RodA [Prochlorococcus sp. AH-716-M10]|nr:rod shape-determining protein RodA [Prochlorococcus sp. AH-716-M10]